MFFWHENFSVFLTMKTMQNVSDTYAPIKHVRKTDAWQNLPYYRFPEFVSLIQ